MDSHAGYYVGVNLPSDYCDNAPAIAKGNDALLAAVNAGVDTLDQEKFLSATFNQGNPTPDVSAPLTIKDTHADDLAPNDGVTLADGAYTSSDGDLAMVVKGGEQDITLLASPITEEVFRADIVEVIANAIK